MFAEEFRTEQPHPAPEPLPGPPPEPLPPDEPVQAIARCDCPALPGPHVHRSSGPEPLSD